jgi:hypothetical protein
MVVLTSSELASLIKKVAKKGCTGVKFRLRVRYLVYSFQSTYNQSSIYRLAFHTYTRLRKTDSDKCQGPPARLAFHAEGERSRTPDWPDNLDAVHVTHNHKGYAMISDTNGSGRHDEFLVSVPKMQGISTFGT